ncbi:MAG: PAS domain S-box protein [Polyangiaceae bacterium]
MRSLVEDPGPSAVPPNMREGGGATPLEPPIHELYRAFFEGSVAPVFWLTMPTPISCALPPEEQVDAIFRFGVIADANDPCAAIYGLSREQLVGRPLSEVWAPGSYERGSSRHDIYLDFVRRSYRSPWHEYGPTATREGKLKWFWGALWGRLENGSLTDIYGSQIDITSRRDIQFHALFQEAPLAIAITENGVIRNVNSAYARCFGRAESDYPGREIHSDVAERDRSFWMERFSAGEGFECETQGIRADGALFDMEVRVAPLREVDRMVVIVRDLTDLRRAEQHRRRLEDLQRRLIDAVPDPLMVVDRAARITLANQRLASLRGVSPESMVGQSVLELGSTFTSEERMALMRRVFETGQTLDVEDHYRGHYVENRLFPIFEENGVVSSVVIFAREVTEQRRAESALRLKELVFHASAAANGTLDVDGRLVEVNQAFLDLVRIPTLDALRGRPLADFFHGDAVWERAFRAVTTTGHFAGDLPGQRADGTWFTAFGVLTVLRNLEGSTAGFWCSLVDVSASREAARLLADSEARYRTLFEGSSEAILIADLTTLRVKLSNPAACAMFGYSDTGMTDLPIRALHPPKDLASVMREFQANASGRLASIEIPCLRSDGTAFTAEVTTALMVLDGQRCMAGFFRDVTDRILAAELAVKTRELETFNEVMVGRESRIIELKEEVNRLTRELGRPPVYPPVWDDTGLLEREREPDV